MNKTPQTPNQTNWRTKKNTRTPTKAFDVSDVRRITAEALLQQITGGANEASASGSLKTIA